MTNLKITKHKKMNRKDAWRNSYDFRLGTDPSWGSQDFQRKSNVAGLLSKVIVFFVIGIIGVGIFFDKIDIRNFPLFEKEKSVLALFEVKAIDPKGHPIPGAKVYFDKKRVGITDSFGEWRRFLKVRKGNMIRLSLLKKKNNFQLYVVKNILVPLRKEKNKNQLVVKHRVKLTPRNMRKGYEKYFENLEDQQEVASPIIKKESQALDDDNKDKKYKGTMHMNKEVHVELISINNIPHNKEIILQKYLIPEIKSTIKQSQELSQKLSDWIIAISHISAGKYAEEGFPGLIRVVFKNSLLDKQKVILINYSGSRVITATNILQRLIAYIDQGMVNRKNPHKGDNMRVLRLIGDISKEDSVFLSGVQGVSFGRNQWKFANIKGSAGYLSILRNHHLFLRKLVPLNSAAISVSLPSSQLAKYP